MLDFFTFLLCLHESRKRQKSLEWNLAKEGCIIFPAIFFFLQKESSV